MDKLVIAALAGAALASPSYADDAFHCPKPGTVFSFSNGGKVTFGEQDGFTCVATDVKDRPLKAFLGLSTLPDLAKNHAEKLFPFKVGDQFEFDRTLDPSHVSGSISPNITAIYYHDTIKVLRQERLTTPGGTFDTYVVERKSNITNRGIVGAWTWTYWWAPELGYLVKEVDQTHGGYGTDRQWELSSITAPAPASPPATVSTPPASQPAAASTTLSKPTTAARLQELKSLLDRKLITPSEYDAKRKAILDAL